MRVLGTKVITEAKKTLPADARVGLNAWLKLMKNTDASNPLDMQKIFSYMDPVPPQTVFNICGNKYRLIAKINYKFRVVRVQYVLSHSEYDKNTWKEK